jgi:DNA-binding MarR family transcriptional regulator
MKSLKRNGKLSTLEIVLRLEGLFRHRLQPLGLSPLQASIVLYLDRHPLCGVLEIASALCIPTVAAVETVQGLQRKGWMVKPRVNAKRNGVKLRLTVQGTALAQKVKEHIAITDTRFALAYNHKAA